MAGGKIPEAAVGARAPPLASGKAASDRGCYLHAAAPSVTAARWASVVGARSRAPCAWECSAVELVLGKGHVGRHML